MKGSHFRHLLVLGQSTVCVLWFLLLPWWPSRLLAATVLILLAIQWIKQSAQARQQRRLWPNPAGPYPFWLYELRPLLYLLTGLLLAACSQSWWWYPSAILFSCAGLLLWTIRMLQR